MASAVLKFHAALRGDLARRPQLDVGLAVFVLPHHYRIAGRIHRV